MAIAFGVFRLHPDTFWSMTPLEFAALTGSLRPRAGQIDRKTFGKLMQAFPDMQGGDTSD